MHWLIVSDGSRDRTDEIVSRYAQQHPWIELYRMPDRESRDFGGKARSFNTGYNLIKNLPHDAVVSLDADLTFDPKISSFFWTDWRLTRPSASWGPRSPRTAQPMTSDLAAQNMFPERARFFAVNVLALLAATSNRKVAEST